MPTVLPTRRRIAENQTPFYMPIVWLLLPFFVTLFLTATALGHGRLSLFSLGEALEESHEICTPSDGSPAGDCALPLLY